MTPEESPITELLAAVGEGDHAAHNRLWSLIYNELHRLAQHQLQGEAACRTLQPTTLIHEAYLRLAAGEAAHWSGRGHFFAAAAKAMRRICIDHARKRKSLKRGGDQRVVASDEAPAVFDQDPAEVLAIDEVLGRLEQTDPRKAEVVTLRYFAGLTVDETAEALGLSPRTVDNEWRFARVWLYRELSKGDTAVSEEADP